MPSRCISSNSLNWVILCCWAYERSISNQTVVLNFFTQNSIKRRIFFTYTNSMWSYRPKVCWEADLPNIYDAFVWYYSILIQVPYWLIPLAHWHLMKFDVISKNLSCILSRFLLFLQGISIPNWLWAYAISKWLSIWLKMKIRKSLHCYVVPRWLPHLLHVILNQHTLNHSPLCVVRVKILKFIFREPKTHQRHSNLWLVFFCAYLGTQNTF